MGSRKSYIHGMVKVWGWEKQYIICTSLLAVDSRVQFLETCIIEISC